MEIINSKGANKELYLKFSTIKPNNIYDRRYNSKNSLPKFQTVLSPKKTEIRHKMTTKDSKKNIDVNFFIKINEIDQRRKSIFNRNQLLIND